MRRAPGKFTASGENLSLRRPRSGHTGDRAVRPGQAEREALLEAGHRMQAELDRLGLTEEDLFTDFKSWRKVRGAR